MKRNVLITVLTLISFAPLSAQGLLSKLSFGIKADGLASNFLLSDMDDTKSKFGVGASAGGFVKFDISNNFAIQEDIMFSYISSELTQNGIKDTYEALALDVPIYAMGQWRTLSGGRIYVGVGPYARVGISAKMKDSDEDLYKKVNGEVPMTRIVAGGAAQIGYEFISGLQVNISYKIGLTNALDAGKDDHKMNPQTVSLGIGYHF